MPEALKLVPTSRTTAATTTAAKQNEPEGPAVIENEAHLRKKN